MHLINDWTGRPQPIVVGAFPPQVVFGPDVLSQNRNPNVPSIASALFLL